MLEGLPKILVVDACILFSFFKKDSDRRRVIGELSNTGCRLISPAFVFEELGRNKGRIKKFSRINDLGFAFLYSLLERMIDSFPESVYNEFLPEANRISPHGRESRKDDPYFALALRFNSPIWSDEKEFKKQSRVKVFTTRELVEYLEGSSIEGLR